MQVVTIIANRRGTDEWGVMNGLTYRQIEHVAGALVADKMFVAKMLLHGLGKGISGEHEDGGSKDEGRSGREHKFVSEGKLPAWYKPMESRPGVSKISAGVVDLREDDNPVDLFGMQARAAKGTVPEDRHSSKLDEPRRRDRVVKRDDEDR